VIWLYICASLTALSLLFVLAAVIARRFFG
jgi:hypothetical protein